MGANEYWVRVNQIVPSLNEYLHLHWAVKSKVKETFLEEFILVLRHARVPKHNENVKLRAIIYFLERRRRDMSNYGSVLYKFVADGLVREGVIPDDTAKYVSTSEPVADTSRGTKYGYTYIGLQLQGDQSK